MKTTGHGRYSACQETFVTLKTNFDQLLNRYGIKRDELLVRNIDHEIANLETVIMLARELNHAPPDPEPKGPDGPPPQPPPDKPPGGDN